MYYLLSVIYMNNRFLEFQKSIFVQEKEDIFTLLLQTQLEDTPQLPTRMLSVCQWYTSTGTPTCICVSSPQVFGH